jgi:hypothetical protein
MKPELAHSHVVVGDENPGPGLSGCERHPSRLQGARALSRALRRKHMGSIYRPKLGDRTRPVGEHRSTIWWVKYYTNGRAVRARGS